MFIYFEDWSYSGNFETLDAKGMPHGDKIIKVYPADKDPRILDEKYANVRVVEVSDNPFKEEIFHFPERGTFTGMDIENAFNTAGYPESAKPFGRALFRFATEEFQTTDAISIQIDDVWVIDHPIQTIDGIRHVLNNPERGKYMLHLDIFTSHSLARLESTIDFRNHPELLVPRRQGLRLKQELAGIPRQAEGQASRRKEL